METGLEVMYKLFYNTNDGCQDIMQFIFGEMACTRAGLAGMHKNIPL
jgi:hypothetical protein